MSHGIFIVTAAFRKYRFGGGIVCIYITNFCGATEEPIDTETVQYTSWWRHQMGTFSALLVICAGNSSVTMNPPHKGQWHGALMFSMICAWIKGRVNNGEAGDLRRRRAHYDVTVMIVSCTLCAPDIILQPGGHYESGYGLNSGLQSLYYHSANDLLFYYLYRNKDLICSTT